MRAWSSPVGVLCVHPRALVACLPCWLLPTATLLMLRTTTLMLRTTLSAARTRMTADMDLDFATMGAGVVHTLPLPQLLATLKAACPAAEGYSAPPGGTLQVTAAAAAAGAHEQQWQQQQQHAFSLAANTRLLDAFPGPLGPQSSKDKVAKFVAARLAACVEEEGLTDAPAWQADSRRALWELLLLMARHQGQLKVCYSGHSGGGGASKAAGLLKGAVAAAVGATSAGGTAGSDDGRASRSGTPTAAPSSSAAAGADGAAACGSGGEAADSELLRILLPGGAAVAGGGGHQRVLAASAPEMEVQATAAEMQVCVPLLRCKVRCGCCCCCCCC